MVRSTGNKANSAPLELEIGCMMKLIAFVASMTLSFERNMEQVLSLYYAAGLDQIEMLVKAAAIKTLPANSLECLAWINRNNLVYLVVSL